MSTATLHLVSAIAVVIAVGVWILLAMLYAWRCERTVQEALEINERMWAQNEELIGMLISVMNVMAEQRKANEASHEQ